jgi:hypothetical protein
LNRESGSTIELDCVVRVRADDGVRDYPVRETCREHAGG